MLPNAILAGTNKAGTTSLFRYLSDHPETASSRIKELRFFSTHTGEISPTQLALYESYFPNETTAKVILEASPCYLAGGEAVASNIFRHVPDVKLIFVLRDPLTRLFSAFRRRKERKNDLLCDLEFSDYAKSLLEPRSFDHIDARRKAIFQSELESVCYGDLLKPYFKIFGPERIYIGFFEQLSTDPKQFMVPIARHLEIDPSFYSNYPFAIENKTRTYRFKGIQKQVFQLNMLAEPLLNRVPRLKGSIRKVYNLLNETRSKPVIMHSDSDLEAYFEHKNAVLRSVLEEYCPDISLPAWLL